MHTVLLCALAAAAAFAATRCARDIALRLRMLDLPGERSSHFLPTPRGGGAGFVVVTLLGGAYLRAQGVLAPGETLALLSAGGAVACVGWLDDWRSLPAALRFAVHCAAAVWTLFLLGAPGGLPGYIFFFLAITWLINSYNFMDGIDGLAACEALAVGFPAAFLCESPAAALCLLTSSTVFGFLYWNWPRAKIFMGDAGSGFLGYAFALAWLMEAQHVDAAGNTEGFFTLPVLLACFLADSTLTLLWRVFRGEKWYAPHKLHVYQTFSRSRGHSAVSLGCAAATLLWAAPLALAAKEWPGAGYLFACAAYLPILGLVAYMHMKRTVFP